LAQDRDLVSAHKKCSSVPSAGFRAMSIRSLVVLLCASSALAGTFLREARRHASDSTTEARCNVVQRALAEVNKPSTKLDTVMAQFNTTALKSNLALMGSKTLTDFASRVRDESSMQLNGVLQSAADESTDPVTKAFLRTLRLCARCNDFERVGENYDGGYIICADGLKNSGLKGAYSYGINGYDGWGMDLAQRYKIPLYEYDCFDKRAPKPCTGCQVKFSPQCIQGNNESSSMPAFKTFTEHVKLNGQSSAPPSSLMLKVDVEGAEWNVWGDETISSLSQVRQITTELHGISNEYRHGQYLKAMRSLLDAGFSIAHLHGNNHGPMLKYGKYTVPAVLELTMVRRPEGAPKQCPTDIPYSIPEDQRCYFWGYELPAAKLPK